MEDKDTRFEKPPEVVPLPKMDVLRKEKELLGFYLTGHPLDDFRDKISRLSCVELSQIKNFDKGTVCRIACVIESVNTRIASKSGKKFAILTIGEGEVCFELPIWPNLSVNI